jgi:hypothetical protein
MKASISAFLLAATLATSATTTFAQQQPQAPAAPSAPAAPATPPKLGLRVELEPAAMALVKAMSDKLSAAKTMSFTAVTGYESPARTGEPLLYMTLSQVVLQRPDKLRVITLGDGPETEFYYDGKTAQAFEPAVNLVATAQAPNTIDAMLLAAYQHAAIYFPFTDVIVSDPMADFSKGLQIAFVVGKSRVVGGVPTDIVVLADQATHLQMWIGSDDKLPRMIRATYMNDPSRYRHTVELSNWKLDEAVPADAFTSPKLAGARKIPFTRPDAPAPAKK